MSHKDVNSQNRNERRGGRGLLVPAAIAGLILAACGGNGDGVGEPGPGEIGIRLQEWAVVPSESSAAAGEITFRIENVGEETHEFVVIRTDLSVLDLPTEEDGSVNESAVNESAEGVEVVGEVEDVPAGGSAELTVTLESGHYALICNVVEEEDGETESHFQMGMRTDFEAE